jgi:hypothetical protein
MESDTDGMEEIISCAEGFSHDCQSKNIYTMYWTWLPHLLPTKVLESNQQLAKDVIDLTQAFNILNAAMVGILRRYLLHF